MELSALGKLSNASLDSRRIAVSDYGNHRIQVFNASDGTFAFKFGSHGSADGQFSYPSSAAYSLDGRRIAVSDYDNDRIQVFNASDGTFAFKFGSHGSADGQLESPTSVDFGPAPPPAGP